METCQNSLNSSSSITSVLEVTMRDGNKKIAGVKPAYFKGLDVLEVTMRDGNREPFEGALKPIPSVLEVTMRDGNRKLTPAMFFSYIQTVLEVTMRDGNMGAKMPPFIHHLNQF